MSPLPLFPIRAKTSPPGSGMIMVDIRLVVSQVIRSIEVICQGITPSAVSKWTIRRALDILKYVVKCYVWSIVNLKRLISISNLGILTINQLRALILGIPAGHNHQGIRNDNLDFPLIWIRLRSIFDPEIHSVKIWTSEAEFKEFEPRFKFKPRLKYCLFHFIWFHEIYNWIL